MSIAADVIASTSRRMRRKHAAAALATFADDDPVAYEALLDAGELDAGTVWRAENMARGR